MRSVPRNPSRPLPPKQRRSLSHVGGDTRLEGDNACAALLAGALDVPTSEASEQAARAHVHGFHSYPARMHPLTARRLIEAFSQPGDAILDPFCGSGTILVEARLLGRKAFGVDANPLAVRLARMKTRSRTEDERAVLTDAARDVASFADERRKARSGPTHKYGQADLELFDRHVLLELDSLRAGIDRVEDAGYRQDLELVLSAILTKVSRRASDTSENALQRRIAAGYPARLFVRKTEELSARLGEIAGALDAGPHATVIEGDARRLEGIEPRSIALAVSSPPYPGVYDYLDHHAARLRWLRLHPGELDRAEVGARRKLEPLGPQAGKARWQAEVTEVLRALARPLRPDGKVVLLLADSVIAGRAAYAVDTLNAAAPSAGFLIRAVASQPRPHFHGPTARAFAERPRQEAAILLVKR